MREANNQERERFKREYCCSREARKSMLEAGFEITIEAHEALLPGKKVDTFAFGQRTIKDEFIIFRVVDRKKGVCYFPVFGITEGRELAKSAGIAVPRLLRLFNDGNGGGGNGGGGGGEGRRQDNYQMLLLILFARQLMTYHVQSPKPMFGPLKRIYENLLSHPNYGVATSEVWEINDAIARFIKGETNQRNEKFRNIQDFIIHLRERYENLNFRNADFGLLREKLKKKYPSEESYF